MPDLIRITYPDGRTAIATRNAYSKVMTTKELAGTTVAPIDREAFADAIREAAAR